jgi:hypothetical protein
MNDLRTKFSTLDRLESPDVWPEVERRGPRPPTDPDPSPIRRLGIAFLALAVAGAGLVTLVRAFQGPSTTGTTPTPTIVFDPHVITTFPVGPNGQTMGMVAADGSVWVTAYDVKGMVGPNADALFRIDPETNGIAATISMDTAPTAEFGDTGITYGDGSIWVTGGGELADGGPQAVLDRVDPTTNTLVASIPLGGRFGSDVAVNDAGVWVGIFTNANAQVVRVDPETNEVVDRIDLESDYVRQVVAIDGAVMVNELVWSSNEGPCGILTTIAPTDGTVVVREPVEPDCGWANLVVWDGKIWGVLGEQFRPLDPMTTRPDGVGFSFAPQHSPRGFILPDTTGIWYAAYPGANGNGPDTLTRMDPTDGHLDEYITLDHGGRSAVVLDGSLWTLGFEGTLTRIDLESESGESMAPNAPQSLEVRGDDLGRLDCPDSQRHAAILYPGVELAPQGSQDSIADLVRRSFKGFLSGDRIKEHRAEAGAFLAIARSGRVVARIFLTPHFDAWVVQEIAACDGSGISLATPS